MPPPTFPQPELLAAGSFRQMAESLQQQQQLLLQQQQQQQFAAAGGMAGGGGSSSLLALTDFHPTGLPNDSRLATDLLCSTPLELLDDEMLRWIVNLGSSAAPDGTLPFLP